jgi:hypothetical protein
MFESKELPMCRNDLTPKDTEHTFHIFRDAHLPEIIERAQATWPGIHFDEITIGCEYFHARHINHDQYDPGDYDLYLVISASPNYFERVKTESASSPTPGATST